MEIVKIPVERIRALMGDQGKTKELIEKECSVKLAVNSEGEVEVTGETAEVFFAKDVVKAIGRGFNHRDALRIIRDNHQFYLINLKEHFSNEKSMARIKGRVIGENGKMKEEIESATESVVSVYGTTIGIISKLDTMEYAKQAVEMLLSGAQHASVYNYLAKIRRQLLGERLGVPK